MPSILVAVMLLAVGVIAEAQQPNESSPDWVSSGGSRTAHGRAEAFRQGLRELGYIEGQNIAIEWRYAKGNADRLPGLAAELVRLNVRCHRNGRDATDPAPKDATKTIPIVVTSAGDPVGRGLSRALPVPVGTSPGLQTITRELSGKRLEVLKRSFPKLARVAVLYDPYEAR